MEYALNKVTDQLELAVRASKYAPYKCPVCRKAVSLRRGKVKKPYFAHLPGHGTPECDNFVPSHLTLPVKGKVNLLVKRWMELRLVVSNDFTGWNWSLELALPTCNFCRAQITLDVGGRHQTLDMRSMIKHRQIGAELSLSPYRIVSFAGTPDPAFIAEVERVCPGLPSIGAAVFSFVASGAPRGFPIVQQLRCGEMFVFLWHQPAQPDFPDELLVEELVGKNGWNLAIITIPENPSSKCAAWLLRFTRLPVVPSRPSITTIWPLSTRNTNGNEFECDHSDIVLLAANKVPIVTQEGGPIILAQSAASTLSAVGGNESPALFTLKPDCSEIVKVSSASEHNIKIFLAFTSHADSFTKFPSVELVFAKQDGEQEIISLHQRRCIDVVTQARELGCKLEYLSMPPGGEGVLRTEGEFLSSEIKLFSSDDVAPHDKSMRLLHTNAISKLQFFLVDPAYYVDIDFGGLGRICLSAASHSFSSNENYQHLSPSLRLRLINFIFQFRLAVPDVIRANDITLVRALENVKLEPYLIPHYRSLVNEVISNGFEIKNLR